MSSSPLKNGARRRHYYTPFDGYRLPLSLFLFFIRTNLFLLTLPPLTNCQTFPFPLPLQTRSKTCSLMRTLRSQGSGSLRLGSALGQANGTTNARRKPPTKCCTSNPPYHLQRSVCTRNGIETDLPFDAPIHDGTTLSSSTTPLLHSTPSSSALSQASHGLSNARPFSSPPITRSTPTIQPHSTPLQETTPPAHIAMPLGPCRMSSSTAIPTGKPEVYSSIPSTITPYITSFLQRTAVAASSSSSMRHKPYYAPCPCAPLTRPGPEPGRFVPRRLLLLFSFPILPLYGFFGGNWLPSDRGVRAIVSTLILTSLSYTPFFLPTFSYA
jgi:hypothetical protein